MNPNAWAISWRMVSSTSATGFLSTKWADSSILPVFVWVGQMHLPAVRLAKLSLKLQPLWMRPYSYINFNAVSRAAWQRGVGILGVINSSSSWTS